MVYKYKIWKLLIQKKITNRIHLQYNNFKCYVLNFRRKLLHVQGLLPNFPYQDLWFYRCRYPLVLQIISEYTDF